jgi:hypothetical protein
MNCERVREHLSAYHDGELPDAVRLDVESHLGHCIDCRQEFTSLKKLSSLFEQTSSDLAVPTSPSGWAELQNKLGETRILSDETRQRASRRNIASLVVLAASLLLVVSGLVWFTNREEISHHASASLDLNQFVTDFQSDPTVAQARLLSNFHGQVVTPEEATSLLHRRPAFLDRVPKDYQLVSLNVLQMPCCKCPQGVYRTPSGETVCIFEHELGSGVLTDKCPMIKSKCGDRDVKLAEVGDVLLVNWASKEHSFTAVGLDKMESVIHLVDAIDGTSPNS